MVSLSKQLLAASPAEKLTLRVLCRAQQDIWVQCDECSKWRKMPPGTDESALPDQWYCHMNPDPAMAAQGHAAPQEPDPVRLSTVTTPIARTKAASYVSTAVAHLSTRGLILRASAAASNMLFCCHSADVSSAQAELAPAVQPPPAGTAPPQMGGGDMPSGPPPPVGGPPPSAPGPDHGQPPAFPPA